MIEGLSHVPFVVRDLARMQEILETVLGVREVYASGEKTFPLAREKFFVVGSLWIAVMEGEPHSRRTYDHIAFKIPDRAFDACLARIESLGLEIKPARPRVEGEGRSIYFYDHDNHLFELHTGTLDERLAAYARGNEPAE